MHHRPDTNLADADADAIMGTSADTRELHLSILARDLLREAVEVRDIISGCWDPPEPDPFGEVPTAEGALLAALDEIERCTRIMGIIMRDAR